VIVRKIVVNTIDADFVREAWHVPNCRTLLCTRREVWKGKRQLSCECRYFVSSLDASQVSSERFLEWVCGHWQRENRLHLMKDRWWDENKHVLFRPGLGEIGSALTDLALSLLGWVGVRGVPMTRRAMQVALQPRRFLANIGF
jgi:predicted transposase YbfD/YdcC